MSRLAAVEAQLGVGLNLPLTQRLGHVELLPKKLGVVHKRDGALGVTLTLERDKTKAPRLAVAFDHKRVLDGSVRQKVLLELEVVHAPRQVGHKYLPRPARRLGGHVCVRV